MKVFVKDLAEEFEWEQIVGDQESLYREVVLGDTNRPGLELAGYLPDPAPSRIVVLGEKESRFIAEFMDEVAQRRSFEYLTKKQIPCIVVSEDLEIPEVLIEIAERKNFPVFRSHTKTSRVVIGITNFLDERLAESMIIHGELLRIFGVGVLITGKSGMGKSEIALELIKRGHQLIADDRVDCYHIHNTLLGRTPDLLKGFMEMRGVGIINVPRMFGAGSYASSVHIGLHIVLEPFDDTKEYDRVGIEDKEYTDIFGIKILKMRIPVSSGRPMATIIETAVTNYLLIKSGIDSAKEFEERVIEKIERNRMTGEENDECVTDL